MIIELFAAAKRNIKIANRLNDAIKKSYLRIFFFHHTVEKVGFA